MRVGWVSAKSPTSRKEREKWGTRTTNSSPNNITKTTTYYLDLAGNVTQLVYPTGRTVNYTHDSADRPSTAADASNGITYATDWTTPPASTNCTAGAVCYTPQGSAYSMSIGQTSSFTGFNISETFNNRLQPNEIKASSSAGSAIDITYSFVDPVTNHNAGHVYGITNNLNSNRSQTFTYDQLNRVSTAGTTATTGTYCWGYQFSYDAWANLNSQAGLTGYGSCSEYSSSATADGNNHLSGLSYDGSGNTLSDGSYSYTWDGESQMKTAAGVTYTYDGDGRRAAKVGSKLYWYGSGGEILSETDASGNTLNDYIFFGSKRVAMVPASGSALYYAEDSLGTSRIVVQSNGTLCYDADFTPFGSEHPYTSTCAQNYKFEGKERDTETQNDDFGARYYSWRFGRWLSSDWSATPVPVPYANLTNPQTLNLYGMVADDPESFADLDGHLFLCGPACEGYADDPEKGKEKTPPPPPPPPAQNQSNAMNYAKGGGKIALGVGLVATTAFGDVPGGVAGALIVTSAILGGTTTAVSGVADVVGTATKTDVSKGQEALEATGNLPGLIVSAATGGNFKAGQTAATIGDVASLAMSPKEATKNLATAVDAGRTVFSAGSLLKSAWNSFSSAMSGAFAPSPGPPVIQNVPGPPQ